MWKKLTLSTLAFIVLVSIMWTVAYKYTSTPQFCSKCHYIEPYVTSWQQSSHSSVNCLRCHESRGPLGMVVTKLRGLNFSYQHFTKNYTVLISAKIEESNCLACHFGDVKYYTDAPKLTKIDHYQAIKSYQSCLSCHRETGHAHAIDITPEFKKTWK